MNEIGTTARLGVQNGNDAPAGASAGVSSSDDAPGDGNSHDRNSAPVVWLIGKVQSGKSSVVRAITASSQAEVGSGFKACTRTARIFDFPASAPILRFLDTRGLGEVDYDPAEDLAFAERRAHLLLITMRAMDTNQTAIVAAATAVRKRHPAWPVIVAQTCLHEGYAPGQKHITPYPFSPQPSSTLDLDSVAPNLAPDLRRCLEFQRKLFSRLPGNGLIIFVPVDLTGPTDGLPPANYGLHALADALVLVAPDAMRAAIETMPGVALDQRLRDGEPMILGYALAAAGSDVVPVAGAIAVSAIQARLLQKIARTYGAEWDRRTLAEFASALGAGFVTRFLLGMGARQLAKLIPAYGQSIGAATAAISSFAITFAIGKAAIHFHLQRQRGRDPADTTAAVYRQALRDALQLARAQNLDGSGRRDPA